MPPTPNTSKFNKFASRKSVPQVTFPAQMLELDYQSEHQKKQKMLGEGLNHAASSVGMLSPNSTRLKKYFENEPPQKLIPLEP